MPGGKGRPANGRSWRPTWASVGTRSWRTTCRTTWPWPTATSSARWWPFRRSSAFGFACSPSEALAKVNVHLVDGTFELFRSFYGAPPRRNTAGVEIGAARGLFGSLLRLIKEEHVTHIGCAFDHVIESFRNDLFDGYKTGDGIEPDLLGQFEVAERVTRA